LPKISATKGALGLIGKHPRGRTTERQRLPKGRVGGAVLAAQEEDAATKQLRGSSQRGQLLRGLDVAEGVVAEIALGGVFIEAVVHRLPERLR
jgi:hypothetical protein